MSELDDLYRKVILDHNRHPRNFRRLDEPCECSDGVNPLCGDRLRLCLRREGESLGEVAFEGAGCAISIASASLLTESVSGLNRTEALNLAAAVEAMLRNGADAPRGAPSLAALAGVRAFPTRIKCATLAWRALCAALRGDADQVSTESEETQDKHEAEAKHVRTL